MDAIDYVNYIAALLFVLGLIIGIAWLIRRTGLAPFGGVHRKSGTPRRLAVKEVLALDARHRLVLIERDDQEHLVLIGPQSELVIETGIETNKTAGTESADATNQDDRK